MDRLYTLTEAAGLIHGSIKPRRLREAIAAGKLAAIKIGKNLLVSQRDINEWLEQSKCPAQTPAPGSNSTAQTASTAPRRERASRGTSTTSSGQSTAGSANVQRVQNTAALLKSLSKTSSQSAPQSPSPSPARVAPIR